MSPPSPPGRWSPPRASSRAAPQRTFGTGGPALLAHAGLAGGSRIVMEKPFGTDLDSAVSLNQRLHAIFDEEQIFRIDHFRGDGGVPRQGGDAPVPDPRLHRHGAPHPRQLRC